MMAQRIRRMTVVVLMIAGLVAGLVQPAGATDPPPECGNVPATIHGLSGLIVGTPGDDVIYGSPGVDTIRGNGGNDLLCGGAGDDDIYGGSGNDGLCGGFGDDTLSGDAGQDVLNGDDLADPGNDGCPFFDIVFLTSLDASADDDDEITGCGVNLPSGDDILKGGSDRDLIGDVCGYNHAYGGGGSDIIAVSGYADAGSGDDFFDAGDTETLEEILDLIFGSGFAPAEIPEEIRIFIEALVFVFILLETDGGGVFAFETCPTCHDAIAKGGSGSDLVAVHGGRAEGGSGQDLVGGIDDGDDVRGGSSQDRLANIPLIIGHGDFPVFPMTLNGGAAGDLCVPSPDDTVISCEEIEGP